VKVLLDTNICIAVMRGRENAVARLVARSPEDCAVSTVTAYELFTGVVKCQEPMRESAKILRLLTLLRLISFDESAAQHAARVRADLERSGKICGPYDLLLAAHALSLGLSLATNNIGEFSRVTGLRLEDWLA
jgi:tRNA(fMet)-specific endonuclease VapC